MCPYLPDQKHSPPLKKYLSSCSFETASQLDHWFIGSANIENENIKESTN
jgi:hypothetical protein